MKTGLVYRHSESGFSLVELVLVISIIGILTSIATLNFKQWLTKNRVEAQVRQMATAFSELRVKSLTTKQRHSITLNRSSYVLRSYSSEGENKFTGGTVIPSGTHSVEFPLKSNATTDHDGTVYDMDGRGLLSTVGGTVYLDYRDASPAIDCLKIHYIRINPGKRNAAWSVCNDK